MKDENPFRQKLYNHTVPVPDHLWNRIESQLPSDKKRFPFFWFTMSLSLLLTGALIFWYAGPGNSENKTRIENDPEQSAAVVSINQAEQVSSSTSPASFSEVASTSITSNSKILPAESEVALSSNQPDYSLNTATKNTTPRFTNKAANRKDSNNNSSLTKNQSTGDVEFISSGDESVTQEILTPQAIKTGSITDFLSGSDLLPLSAAERKFNLKIKFIKPDPSCYKFTGENGSSPITFDLFGGPGFSPRSFEINNSESNLFAEARKSTERSQYAWAAGARVNYNLSHGIALRAGLMYEQIGDIFDYRDTSAFVRQTRVDSFFGANGVFLYADTNYVLIFGTSIKKIHNRYHHIDVPLLVSYELPMGRATIMLNAGPVLNLTTSFRGQILDIQDPNFLPKHITPGAKDEIKVYKTSLGLSLYLGAGLVLPLNENISALIEPRFLYRIKPVTLAGYPLQERRHYAGLNLGVRYHFN